MVEDKILYTFRGWLAFVAFMDLGVTFRSFFENKCIIGTQSNLQADENFIHGTNIYVVNDKFLIVHFYRFIILVLKTIILIHY